MYSDAKIDEIVREYWVAVEKNNKFEKEISNEISIAKNLKIKYSK
jgi:hypothetical protein